MLNINIGIIIKLTYKRFLYFSLFILYNSFCYGQYFFDEFVSEHGRKIFKKLPFKSFTYCFIDSSETNNYQEVDDYFLDSLGNLLETVSSDRNYIDKYSYFENKILSETNFSNSEIYSQQLYKYEKNNLVEILCIEHGDTVKNYTFTIKGEKPIQMTVSNLKDGSFQKSFFYYKANKICKDVISSAVDTIIYNYLYQDTFLKSVYKGSYKVSEITYYDNGLIKDVIRYKPGIEHFDHKKTFVYNEDGVIKYEIILFKNNKGQFQKWYLFYVEKK